MVTAIGTCNGGMRLNDKNPLTVNLGQATQNNVCPYVQMPFEECYCRKLSSIYSFYVIKYCCGFYRECKTYKKHRECKN